MDAAIEVEFVVEQQDVDAFGRARELYARNGQPS